jgi:hypothetical protein
VGLKSLKSLNLTNGYPNNKNKKKKKNNKVKSKPLELRSRVKTFLIIAVLLGTPTIFQMYISFLSYFPCSN